MQIKLKSDFIDYYDHAFDNFLDREKAIFEINRYANNRKNIVLFSPSRTRAFDILNWLDYSVPLRGNFIYFLNFFELFNYKHKDFKDFQFVLYEDEYSHKAENKKLVTFDEWKEIEDNQIGRFDSYIYYASEFIHTTEIKTKRYLQIGDKYCRLEYKSDDKWRSNFGNVDITIKTPFFSKENNTVYPIFAIDTIEGIGLEPAKSYTREFALDFNVAPQIKGTGLEEILKPQQIREYLESWIKRNKF